MKEKSRKISLVKYHIGNKCKYRRCHRKKKITEAEYDTAKLNGKL